MATRFLRMLVAGFFLAFDLSCSISIGRGEGGHETHYLGALIFFAFGLLLFYGGFQNYRKFRLMENIPLMAIRAIPMGLVHIRGKATGDARLTSPLTRTPCFRYHVVVEEYSRQDRHDLWSLRLRHADKLNFYVEDPTGKALVDSHLAELVLDETFAAETGPGASKARTLDPSLGAANNPSSAELLDYLSQTNVQVHAELAGEQKSTLRAMTDMEHSVSFLPAGSGVDPGHFVSRRLRFKESCILPDRNYIILGTCSENPNAKGEHDRNIILKGDNERTFVISSKSELALEKQTRKGGVFLILIGGGLMLLASALFLKDVGIL
jgi:hypothetical protein